MISQNGNPFTFLDICLLFIYSICLRFHAVGCTDRSNNIIRNSDHLSYSCVTFEVFTSVTMKNAVFWDMGPCRSCVNRRFGGTYRLHLQGRKICERGTSVSRWLESAVYPENEIDTFLRNVGSHMIYTAPYPRKWHSTCLTALRKKNI
jgi:hypothetical protein